MRWRGQNFLSSTWLDKTAISSWSSSANNGTCFRISGSEAISHLLESSAKVLNRKGRKGVRKDREYTQALDQNTAQTLNQRESLFWYASSGMYSPGVPFSSR